MEKLKPNALSDCHRLHQQMLIKEAINKQTKNLFFYPKISTSHNSLIETRGDGHEIQGRGPPVPGTEA